MSIYSKSVRSIVTLLVTGASFVASTAGQAQVSGPFELGTLGGAFTYAHDINDLGEIVGIGATGSGFRGFRWTELGGLMEIGTLGGGFSRAVGVNNLGAIAGTSANAEGTRLAFVWTDSGGFTPLPTLGGGVAQAFGMNELSTIVGQSRNAANESRAFRWDASTGIVELGNLGGVSTVAFAVNDLRQAVGFSGTVQSQIFPYHGVLWQPDGTLVELPPLGGDFSRADGINELGQIVGGVATVPGGDQVEVVAVIWSPTLEPTILGSLPGTSFSVAVELNNLGMVVGTAFNDPNVDGRAFLWTSEAGMVELPGLGGPFTSATAITDELDGSVHIAGNTTMPGEGLLEFRAVRWIVPAPPPPPPSETVSVIRNAIENAISIGTLSEGLGEGLLGTLGAASRQLAAGNDHVAARLLEALTHQIDAYVTAGFLSQVEAGPLLEVTEGALAQLG